ncbi:MAG: hypothetical protein K2J95_08160 [Lachnospiraceae bacterium]|nr:hypothetical protein [Lachnospiraceae bacterium]
MKKNKVVTLFDGCLCKLAECDAVRHQAAGEQQLPAYVQNLIRTTG